MVSVTTPTALQKVYWFFFFLLVATSVALWYFLPHLREDLIRENGYLENLSAILFLAGFLVGSLAVIVRFKGNLRLFYAMIPALSLLAFLDEISFGLAYMNRDAFYIMGYPVDAVHDLIAVAAKIWRSHGTPVIDLVVIAVLCGSGAAAYLNRKRYMPWVMQQVRRYPAFDYIRFAVIVIGIAQILDLNVFDNPISPLLEELLESTGALALAFSSVAMFLPGTETICRDTPES